MAKMQFKAKLCTHHNDITSDETVETIEIAEIAVKETTNKEDATMIAATKTSSNSWQLDSHMTIVIKMTENKTTYITIDKTTVETPEETTGTVDQSTSVTTEAVTSAEATTNKTGNNALIQG